MFYSDIRCKSLCCNDNHNDVVDTEFIYSCPVQSSVQQSNATEDTQQEQVQVSFDDENPGEVVEIPANIEAESPYIGKNVEIQHFLKRPVKLYTYTWTLGSATPVEIDPWNLYFNHTSTKKKIDNYYLLRCKLKVKFVINASPFHYGSLLISYKPLQKFLTPALINNSLLTQDASNVGFSQLPRTYIYPQTSQGSEMTLPFLWPKEWIDVTTASELTNMGTLRLCPMTPLQFANSGTGVPITVQVYAWPEDIVISGPTVKAAMQSYSGPYDGEVFECQVQSFMDEYGDNGGTISAPASAVAKIAGYLEEAPIIGPFATATKMVASGVGSIARFFGFTNVPVIEDVKAVIPTPFPMIASPEIGTQIEKLTLDPKNELTIDPATVGVSLGDELLISNFTQRESYITQFPWAITNAPDDILFSSRINPNFFRMESITNQDLIQGTPLWLASRLFAQWKGDIKLRFKFICSQYHRGRVRISWDPVGAIGTTADSTTEVYTKIVDLAKCTDITVNIPYMQTTAFQAVDRNFTQLYANDGSKTHTPFYDNGVLTVRVLTDLAAPLNTADIQVLVFVSGGDNLEFANPSEPVVDGRLYSYPVQSSITNYDIDHDDTEMALEPSQTPAHTHLLYQGEVVTSLRQLFRRMAFYRYTGVPSSIITSTADNTVVYSRIPRYPVYPGYVSDGLDLADSLVTPGNSKAFNFVKYHPITWISQAFLGCRGAINYRINNTSKEYISDLKAVRSNTWFTNATTVWNNFTSTSATNNCSRNLMSLVSDTTGASMTNTRTNAGLGISVPFYSRYKFRTVSALANNTGSSLDDSNLDWFQTMYYLTPKASSNATSTYSGTGLEFYTGAGTDFSPIFFVNVPTLYRYSALPNSA